MAGRLEQAVATLEELITLTGDLGLRDSAQFLAMARLHLLIDLNDISDREFRALCDALEGKTAKQIAADIHARAPRGRSRRDGEVRTLRRWQCPQDAPVRRGRRKRAEQ